LKKPKQGSGQIIRIVTQHPKLVLCRAGELDKNSPDK